VDPVTQIHTISFVRSRTRHHKQRKKASLQKSLFNPKSLLSRFGLIATRWSNSERGGTAAKAARKGDIGHFFLLPAVLDFLVGLLLVAAHCLRPAGLSIVVLACGLVRFGGKRLLDTIPFPFTERL
jgi:hypothetical protein